MQTGWMSKRGTKTPTDARYGLTANTMMQEGLRHPMTSTSTLLMHKHGKCCIKGARKSNMEQMQLQRHQPCYLVLNVCCNCHARPSKLVHKLSSIVGAIGSTFGSVADAATEPSNRKCAVTSHMHHVEGIVQ